VNEQEQIALIDDDLATTDDEIIEDGNAPMDDAEQPDDLPAEEEVVVTIGGIEPEAPSEEEKSSNFKQLREHARKLERENRELKRQSNPEVQALGKEPTLSDPDIDYDEDKLRVKMRDYLERERKIKEQDTRIAEEQRKQDEAWQRKLASLGEQKAALGLKDYDEAELSVQEILSDKQQAIIVKGAKNPALVLYALGKNPSKAKELAAMSDLVEYAFAVANLENKLEMTKKTAPPAPEGRIPASGSKAGGLDSHLARLEAEASKTGDRSQVIRYKQKLRDKKAA